jgi:hypothetical protein
MKPQAATTAVLVGLLICFFFGGIVWGQSTAQTVKDQSVRPALTTISSKLQISAGEVSVPIAANSGLAFGSI